MVHRNAPLTPTGRLRLARCVVEHGWTLRQAAERFQVAHTTAKRWADRYRTHGPAGMDDHSRLAYSEILTDDKAATCAGFLRRAHAWFAANGVTVQRVLTDNAWAYTKTTWRRTCAEPSVSGSSGTPGDKLH